MHELTDCLGSRQPRLFDTRISITAVRDPVAWALELIARNAPQSRLQVRIGTQVAMAEGSDTARPLDPMDAANLRRFAHGIVAQEPMHGSLDLLQYGSDGGSVRDGAEWVWELARANYIAALQACNPLGFYVKGSLWLSAGEHRYAEHCDLADGFLVHLQGRKRVRVWPVPERYRNLGVFNYADFGGRMCTTPEEFELAPGHILFIPGGAIHDVVAERAGPAVSVSLHMGSPYPLLTLCEELNLLLGFDDVHVPAHMQSREKFGIHLFEPARFAAQSQGVKESIPPALVDVLSDVLQSGVTHTGALRELLARWWQRSVAAPHYQTPYP